jgi:homoserine dehydrogenase
MKQQLTIGMIGFGCVGQGLYDILTKNSNTGIRIKSICVKDKQKKRTLPAHYFTYQFEDILQDPEINTIVELIDDADQAFIMVQKALKHKKSVVTANKKMIAEHLEELLQLQKIYNTPLLYEASSCGGIPIIRMLEEYYNNEHLQSVSGIFNGSSNYILTHIFQYGKSYQDALIDAQRLGFAESNPSLDVDGFDAKFKLIILTAHAFGIILKPSDVFNTGISSLLPDDLNWIRQAGLSVKLEARSEIVQGDQLRVSVLPVLIPADSLLDRVSYEYNTVVVKAAFSDQQQFIGKGAGGHPTGSAVLSDIAALQYDYRYEYHKIRSSQGALKFSNQHHLRVIISTDNQDILQQFHDAQFSVTDSGNGRIVAIGKVTLQDLLKNQSRILYSKCFVAELQESDEEIVRKTLHQQFAYKCLSSLVSAC